MEIVPVTNEQELEECLDLRIQVFVVEQGVPMEEELDEWDTPTACRHLLIREEGRVAATGRLRSYDEATAKLQRIAVRQDLRGKGYGKLVIEQLEAIARQDGFARAMLDAQCQAEEFYAKLGYRTLSPETFLDAGIPHVRMVKELG